MWWAFVLWGGLILSGVLVVCAIIAGALELYDKRTVFVIEALRHDKSEAVHGRLRSAVDIGLQLGVIFLRLAVIAYAGFWLWTFHFLFWSYLHRLGTKVIDVFVPSGTNVTPIALFTILIGGLIGPGFAVAAIMLAAANKYLVLALLAMAGTYLSLMMSLG